MFIGAGITIKTVDFLFGITTDLSDVVIGGLLAADNLKRFGLRECRVLVEKLGFKVAIAQSDYELSKDDSGCRSTKTACFSEYVECGEVVCACFAFVLDAFVKQRVVNQLVDFWCDFTIQDDNKFIVGNRS